MKIKNLDGEFVEYETPEERRDAILDLVEERVTVALRPKPDAHALNKAEFETFLDEMARKVNLPAVQEEDAVVEEKVTRSRKAKTPVEPDPEAPKEDG